jgi:phospholipid-binding lipoprotein MlaA
VRDSAGLPLDLMASPATVINDGATKVEITSLQLVSKRANLLGASRVLDDIALDKYSFIRDAYLARRRSLVYDGNPPESKADDEDKEAPATPAAPGAPASAASAASGPAK